jgi:hypothetical protein
VDPTVSLGILGKRIKSFQCCDLNSGSSASQPITLRFINVTIPTNSSSSNNDDEEDINTRSNVSVFH